MTSPESRTNSTLRERALTLVAVSLGVLFAVSVGELSLRFMDPSWRAEMMGQAGLAQRTLMPDSQMGYRPVNESYFKRGRTKPYAAGQREGVFRVFGLGDSFVNRRADMSPHDPVFFEVLENSLEERVGASGRVEVFHFGVSGYSQLQHLEILKRYLPVFRPNLAVMQVYIGNDLAENAGLIRRELVGNRVAVANASGNLHGNPAIHRASLSERLRLLKNQLTEWLDWHSLIYQRITKWRIERRAKVSAHERYVNNVTKVGSEPPSAKERPAGAFANLHMFDLMSPARQEATSPLWERTEELIRQMSALCEKHECRLLVVLLPHKVQVADAVLDSALRQYNLTHSEFDTDLPNQRFARMLTRLQLEYLDLLPVYRRSWRSGVDPYEPGGHIGREGHRLTGEAIVARLDRLGWLGCAGSDTKK